MENIDILISLNQCINDVIDDLHTYTTDLSTTGVYILKDTWSENVNKLQNCIKHN
jgi:hypothetical protein